MNDNAKKSQAVSESMKIINVLFTVVSSIVYFALAKIVPQFSETFQAFGSELPFLTSTVVALIPLFKAHMFVALALLVLWVFSISVNRFEARMSTVIKYWFAASLVMFLLSIVAMYLPIFKTA